VSHLVIYSFSLRLSSNAGSDCVQLRSCNLQFLAVPGPSVPCNWIPPFIIYHYYTQKIGVAHLLVLADEYNQHYYTIRHQMHYYS
jgi:hypothetical protein